MGGDFRPRRLFRADGLARQCGITPAPTKKTHGRDAIIPRQMVNIQGVITIMGGREISRPYQGNRFFMFLFLAPFTI